MFVIGKPACRPRSADRPIHTFRRVTDLLASVYGWFTEGFETADLKERSVDFRS
jgi:hypothetical protein